MNCRKKLVNLTILFLSLMGLLDFRCREYERVYWWEKTYPAMVQFRYEDYVWVIWQSDSWVFKESYYT